ncbi:iron-sulfur cluster assembly scaffold protein [Desulforamulus aquiferis]|uniref:Iron-sulfur cluster assembly scaffold protein n=1 Tax=Desulforamulus aquiferis TaxID=1397668 RepID=A0AAW7ZHJ3_9FIRM|nr:iron-sulfur cluster assembly scaffold protein [Desulforamulus aquiferis]MDO7788784.1 iron-sulfur cluster assembly scaffold protein [Desulforamulus aquiferis]
MDRQEGNNSLSYTEKALEHFSNPRNVGVVKDFNGRGEIGEIDCGDVCEVTLFVENEIIKRIKFRVYGCAGAIATSSAVTELAKGKSCEEALQLTDNDVVEYLGGLPEQKKHCSLLGIRALKQSIYDYWLYKQLLETGQVANRAEHEKIKEDLFQQFADKY